MIKCCPHHNPKPQLAGTDFVVCVFFSEHITQGIVKSHLETCQYSAEDMKRFSWVQYTPEETRVFQNKVGNTQLFQLRQ